MNDHQRAMARKAGKTCGYADGGPIRGGPAHTRLPVMATPTMTLPGQMNRARRPLLSRPAPIARPYAEGGVIDRIGGAIMDASRAVGIVKAKAPETEDEKAARLQENVDRAMESAREAQSRSHSRRGPIYPGGKPYAQGGKVSKVLEEFEAGTLRSGSKSGPKVTKKSQALAIGLSEARKAGEKV